MEVHDCSLELHLRTLELNLHYLRWLIYSVVIKLNLLIGFSLELRQPKMRPCVN